MAMSSIGLTARWVAANRARETELPGRLFADPFAAALAGEEGFVFLTACQRARSVATDAPDPYLSIRTRFFDDELMLLVNEASICQIVILAAGMDSRALRLAWPRGTAVFELDRDDVVDHKEAVIRDLGAVPKCLRKVVRVDLEHNWVGPLLRAGFDTTMPTAFLAEGLLVYLESDCVSSLLQGVSRLATPGSWLGMDVVDTSLLSSPHVQPLLHMLKQFGCPWRFGISDPKQFLERLGWTSTVIVVGETRANYGRWPYPVVPRDVSGIPRSFFVTAWRF